MTVGAIFNGLFLDVHMAASGSFSYQPTMYAYFIYGMSEISVLYSLILVVRHALQIKLQAHRQLIFGLVILFATSLTMPNEALYRTCGAIGAVLGVLLITGSILRSRLFDPLTQLNGRLQRQSRRLRKAIHQNSELLEKVRQADQAKTRFIGYISHEVRNPISNIYMTMQNVTEHPEFYNEPLPVDYDTDLQGINRQTQYLKRLIDDLLDLGRIEADALKLSCEPLNPVPILHDIQQAAANQLHSDVLFQPEYPAHMPDIYADRLRFTQIVNNIVGNAVKFTECGTITLAAVVEGCSIRFTVRDTGVGMNEQVLSHLYEPYTQDAREVRQPHRGTGLGLSISKRLIELHGGTIQITSKFGEGTAVSFTMPVASLMTSAEQSAPAVP